MPPALPVFRRRTTYHSPTRLLLSTGGASRMPVALVKFKVLAIAAFVTRLPRGDSPQDAPARTARHRSVRRPPGRRRMAGRVVEAGTLPRGSPPPAVSPVADLKALQGQWKVVRVEKGKDADSSWAAICQFGSTLDPATTSRFSFGDHGQEDLLEIKRLGPEPDTLALVQTQGFCPPWHVQESHYRLDPMVVPKAIDLFQDDPWGGSRQLTAMGLYAFEGSRLKICLTRYRPMFDERVQPPIFRWIPIQRRFCFLSRPIARLTTKRPFRLTVGRSPKRLKTASRFPKRKSAASSIGSPTPLWASRARGRYLGMVTLDPAKQPKRIAIRQLLPGGTGLREELHGIYKFEGDRLTIAYRKGGPPEQFESKPGSGVTLLVLERPKPAAATVLPADSVTTLSASGTTEPCELVDISAQLAGKIVRIRRRPSRQDRPELQGQGHRLRFAR